MNNKVTFETLPSAVMELTEKVDLLISMFSTKIEKREEIPKYMNTETALEYLRKTGLTISKSELYKLTASNSIPVYKEGNSLFFTQQELDKWCEENIQIKLNKERFLSTIKKYNYGK